MKLSIRVATAVLFVQTGCQSTTSDDWDGGASTPFTQAERSCEEQTQSIRSEEPGAKREFFVGCMSALGWTPKPGRAIELFEDEDQVITVDP